MLLQLMIVNLSSCFIEKHNQNSMGWISVFIKNNLNLLSRLFELFERTFEGLPRPGKSLFLKFGNRLVGPMSWRS